MEPEFRIVTGDELRLAQSELLQTRTERNVCSIRGALRQFQVYLVVTGFRRMQPME